MHDAADRACVADVKRAFGVAAQRPWCSTHGGVFGQWCWGWCAITVGRRGVAVVERRAFVRGVAGSVVVGIHGEG